MVDAVDPTNHFRATWGASDGNSFAAAGISRGLKVLMIPWNFAAEVVDIVALPVKLVKNGADAAMHGVMSGFAPKPGAAVE